ncbi:MAG: 4-hydroxythreonine-4-phosphate dehydrogenase PdxA [Deltaproteobacteria bacterium]|nr:MAG: 4-hydroxythreonine-4-phosphate dehydrogenase PdxA [Deltaproteobacteria bacterium]
MDDAAAIGRPLIGITMGDPAGVGPEIILKALSNKEIFSLCVPIIIGDLGALDRAAKVLKWHGKVQSIQDPFEAGLSAGSLNVMCPYNLPSGSFEPGLPTVEGGEAAARFIKEAVKLAVMGKVGGIVTCPVNKAMLNKAGYNYEGHTQMIASLTRCDSYVMMLAGERLRVSLVTIHVPLAKVPQLITQQKVIQTITITHRALERDFGLARPRIGVAALNPHAGEAGLFGKEEEEVLRPAVTETRSQGMEVQGPFPSDTLFWRAARGEFDAVVAMYHDQGLAPLKLVHFYDAVNVTLGLPIVRTSVDHGTAYDLAGTGKANPNSLVNALMMAAMIARNRGASKGVCGG